MSKRRHIETCLATLLLAASSALARQAAEAPRAEMRSEASIVGADVHLRQVLRWSIADAAFFAPVADVTVGHFAANQKRLELDMATVRRVLEGAGVGRGEVLLSGSTVVEVTRLDAASPAAKHEAPRKPDKELSLDDLITQRAGTPAQTTPAPQPLFEGNGAGAAVPTSAVYDVRESIYQEAVRRTGAKREELEITFEAGNEKVLKLAEPAFKWVIAPGKYRGRAGLGQCSWLVIINVGDESRRVEVVGTVRRWQDQVVTLGGIASGEVIRDGDIEEKRVLVDRPADEMLLSREAARTMEASQPIPGGTVLTGRMVRRVMLVKRGQLVSVELQEGAFQVKSVARAEEDGFYGQCIKVTNPESRVTLQVTITGPQEARLGAPSEKENRP